MLFKKGVIMKKINISKICNIVSVALIIIFIIKSIIDYFQYSSIINSAPFYAWIIVNTLYFIVPAIVIFIIGIIVGKNIESNFNKMR